MKLSTLAAVFRTHAKAAAVVTALTLVTGGGVSLAAVTVADSHGAPDETTSQVTQSADSHDSDSPDAGSSDSPDANGTSTGPVDCATAKNHGAYVSSIAQATPSPAPSGSPSPDANAHGKAVSAAAHSDCGKPHASASPSGSAASHGKPSNHPTHPARPQNAHTHPASSH